MLEKGPKQFDDQNGKKSILGTNERNSDAISNIQQITWKVFYKVCI